MTVGYNLDLNVPAVLNVFFHEERGVPERLCGFGASLMEGRADLVFLLDLHHAFSAPSCRGFYDDGKRDLIIFHPLDNLGFFFYVGDTWNDRYPCRSGNFFGAYFVSHLPDHFRMGPDPG